MKKDDDEHPNKKDFVDILLQLQKNGMLDFELSHDNLKAILVDMFVGGSDTTSTTLEWAMGEDLDMIEVNALTAFRKNPLYLVPILHSS
nr:cytochrome p450 71a1 [Quercus suber]